MRACTAAGYACAWPGHARVRTGTRADTWLTYGVRIDADPGISTIHTQLYAVRRAGLIDTHAIGIDWRVRAPVGAHRRSSRLHVASGATEHVP